MGHPWSNGQVERMNGLVKVATVKGYYYGRHQGLREHLASFVLAYNHAKRLKTLKGLTPYEYILAIGEQERARFTTNPSHFILEPDT